MYSEDEEDPYFVVTHKEEVLLRRLRKLPEADRKEIERKFIEIALRYAKWGE